LSSFLYKLLFKKKVELMTLDFYKINSNITLLKTKFRAIRYKYSPTINFDLG